MNLNNNLLNKCYDLLEKHDVVWMKRKRKINTKLIQNKYLREWFEKYKKS